MVETNAATLYGFDLDALRPLADRIGPTVEDVGRPISPDEFPPDTGCAAFDKVAVPQRSW
jgi:hypothetical protein